MTPLNAAALALIIPLAMAAPALAQQVDSGADRPGPRMQFSDLDLDGDGALTREELEAARAGRLARADVDGDGLVTRDELIAQATARAETAIDRMLAQADTDGDGALGPAEIDAMQQARRMARMARAFERMDADRDGQVTEAEFDAMGQRMHDRQGEPRRRGQHGHGFWRG